MIDEIKVILEAIGDVGAAGIWLVVAFFVYKLATLASILLVIKIAISKLYDWSITKKNTVVKKVIHFDLNDHIIMANEGNGDRFLRIIEKSKISTGNYIHPSDLDKLEKAIDTYLESKNNNGSR